MQCTLRRQQTLGLRLHGMIFFFFFCCALLLGFYFFVGFFVFGTHSKMHTTFVKYAFYRMSAMRPERFIHYGKSSYLYLRDI